MLRGSFIYFKRQEPAKEKQKKQTNTKKQDFGNISVILIAVLNKKSFVVVHLSLRFFYVLIVIHNFGKCFASIFFSFRGICYPGYQRVFSRAAKPRELFARVTIKTWQKPETALGKSLAPRVVICQNDARMKCLKMV